MDKYRRLLVPALFACIAVPAWAAPVGQPGRSAPGVEAPAPPEGREQGERMEEREHDRVRRMMRAGELLPLEQILEKAKARHPGEVIEVALEHERGQLVYEVEILDAEGVVREFYFDARSGEPLPSVDED